ncbi:vacuolar protein sorting-associated protein 21 [Aplysia californica]|uniref:Vacuolar protein sorting-associated protein 21 n=1 Tax=Aplysia californica TaxID=6500 RepID=A0ABM0ZW89_APLCA|nr:vacuolar protein sorting-associated protein 21 [Aplysia californica]
MPTQGTSASGLAPSKPSFRVVMLGDQGVGKSSISHRFIKDDFLENNAPTVGAAYLTRVMKVGEQTVKLDIWDTAGQERFASLAPMYYRTAQAAVVVYDICSKATFGRALEWVKELHTQAPPNTIVILCGNKADKSEQRQVNDEEASKVAKDKGLLFTEVSAKTGVGVQDIFQVIANKLAGKSNNPVNSPPSEETIKLKKENHQKSSCPCTS